MDNVKEEGHYLSEDESPAMKIYADSSPVYCIKKKDSTAQASRGLRATSIDVDAIRMSRKVSQEVGMKDARVSDFGEVGKTDKQRERKEKSHGRVEETEWEQVNRGGRMRQEGSGQVDKLVSMESGSRPRMGSNPTTYRLDILPLVEWFKVTYMSPRYPDSR
ncbi:hypothetical protein E2C01_071848 [Portunus trituberculatus]|uniref:Uncharacterized protein n=1 Tax=Portunus trituberculatus TaxID=210409 RepID=A0A5B7I661_PORTR|nr:hypothetical protein [Portunus trituberculatus]